MSPDHIYDALSAYTDSDCKARASVYRKLIVSPRARLAWLAAVAMDKHVAPASRIKAVETLHGYAIDEAALDSME